MLLNLIGAGRLGRTLARAWRDAGCCEIGAVLCRDAAHARAAVGFIGAGQPMTGLTGLPTAGLWLIATPDNAIAQVAGALAQAGGPCAADLVFHASGVLDAGVLAPLARQGATCGSLHPALSFAEPQRALGDLPGTAWAVEGDPAALPRLEALALALGGLPFRLAPGGKAAYHAATVVASNYLVTLNVLAQQLAVQAGLDAGTAAAVLGPLMRRTLDNVLALGPAAALTGPIARGDGATVARHLAVIDDMRLDAAYRTLGLATLPLTALPAESREALAGLLKLNTEATENTEARREHPQA
ncbi:DUF2520 domain-containing protein [Chitiniphilus purpureus]|uniref:DUF2520 domain-containing protein n=1 Tax=Chitiniphilus purpureus TaxID=2981137 RepID=A0ABY6DMU7_9NEIS|nr:Rossmann-like and DUF2520 domain-containing protein [Chitiniphilus sp. CD1]UXY15690.1 DUF2520 domain-containing protein [Chitiniphilus sp. CD1]